MDYTDPTVLGAFVRGWEAYQETLIAALAPLTEEQLGLHAATDLRTVGALAAHIIGARARWMRLDLGEGDAALNALARYDRPGADWRTAADLVAGLRATWQVIRNAVDHWTPDDLRASLSGEHGGEPYTLTRQWVLWHLIEHDLHHGGELSYTVGMHGLPRLDL